MNAPTSPPLSASTRHHLTDERDRGLAAEILTGTLRWQRSFDHLIGHATTRKLGSLDPEILAILRLSLYQIPSTSIAFRPRRLSTMR